MTVVYGPNDKGLCTQLWKELIAIRDNHGEPWYWKEILISLNLHTKGGGGQDT